MNSRRALVCSYSAPAPDRDSGSQRMMDFIEFLCEAGWHVEFLATNFTDQPQARILRQRGISVHSAEMLDELPAEGRFDLVLAAFWPVAELVTPIVRRRSPSTRVLVDSVDLHFLRTGRRLFGDDAASGGRLLDDDFGAQMIGELNCYAAADLVLTVSAKEAGKLEDLLGQRTLVACAPDCEELPASQVPFADRRGMLTVGSYQHPPNVQAVEYLCREILPLVSPELLAEHPVYVVGNALDERVRRYGTNLPNVRMVGWVPTVTGYFERSRISVVPLRYGAGTKRKMVQALMSGTPTVSTSIGAEGMNLRHEEHVLVADTPQAFADSIERLISDETLWTRLARNGRAHVLQGHSRDFAKARFLEAVDLVLQQRPKGILLTDGGRDCYNQRLLYQDSLNRNERPELLRAKEDGSQLLSRIQQMLIEVVPPEAKVLVISKGDDELLNAHCGQASHFPQTDDGRYAGYHPGDSGEAIRHLERLRQDGADFLLIPVTSLWWLEFYREFAAHLQRYRLVSERQNAGFVFDLREVKSGSSADDSGRDAAMPDVGMLRQPSTSDSALSPAIRVTGREYGKEFDHVASNDTTARLIAFYLPQFHPIPENDEWWGEGFTEWTNVAKAQPQFPGHHQPRLPTDLGYYDLRLSETRAAQAELARAYGIHGFCYYHYWFHGKRLLEHPFNEVLASGEPDFPFCLCWANEPWSRRWDGRPHDVLQPQTYSAEDDLAHIHWLIPALTDRRAIQVEGKPLLLIYQARDLPEPARTVATWRHEAEKAGLEGLYLMAVETGWDAGWDATQVGFDAKVLFQPQFSMLSTVPRLMVESSRLRVFEYQQAWPVLANPEPVSYLRYDTVFPMWDNTSRKGEEGWVVHNGTPEAYEEWLKMAIERTLDRPPDQRIVFLNAWNEWAEGCHLEPDRQHGLAYLEATRRALLSDLPTPVRAF